MAPISIHRGNSPPSDQPPNPPSNQNQTQSYTQLPDTDLDAIGHHCDLSYCHQLDFLPFRCASCNGTFCLDHRSETAHKCPRAGEWARQAASTATTPSTSTSTTTSTSASRPNIYNSQQCSHLTCKTLIHTVTEPGVRCPECRREYCLRHRLKEGHDCKPPRGAGAGAGSTGAGVETLRGMFAKVRSGFGSSAGGGGGGGKGTAPAGGGLGGLLGGSRKTAKPPSRTVQVNTLKRTAKGDANVPSERRVYVFVEGAAAAAAATVGAAPKGGFYFDSKWKIGRVLDDAARRLGVENVNNRVAGEEERLRVFHVDGGVFLEFGDTLGEKVVQGDTLVLLRGAGSIL
ncbi:AN1-type zinc finger protein [Aspergillus saccharolyticus JOP 1030-1]|uniref:AN1-type domain-containing protein n=1 Tax=Aspergillus saccharolyticus JOP 1030-1 TaxID=1450539 RepID=A0A318ZK51_9EURO|nr:hypothetical protein BP01DRAFT_355005 [Aspergillus saccharolyticus JOP 1030-1]PYH47227.1 hypothetical protein BP01DRAFT_355005 [Aspergillus saccharolyticus JOP 1030-1]